MQALAGRHIRLEPLELHHIDGLAKASADDRSVYSWSFVPQGDAETTAYVKTALDWREAKTAEPFAVVRLEDDVVVGSTRFFLIERWAWPLGHERHGRTNPDATEIGYTWYAPSAIRTAANTEAKLLMLTHAFETWRVLRVCFHTDNRNERSRGALERIGAQFEGVLRSHRLASDATARDSARYSILESDWPSVKAHLVELLNRPSP